MQIPLSIETIEENFLNKIISFSTDQERYQWIMHLGSRLSPYPQLYKSDNHLVRGCQSQMFLYTNIIDERAQFFADSDALISKGLAALLIELYQNQKVVDILRHQLTFLEKTKFFELLTPSRVNGFVSLYKKMKKDLVLKWNLETSYHSQLTQ